MGPGDGDGRCQVALYWFRSTPRERSGVSSLRSFIFKFTPCTGKVKRKPAKEQARRSEQRLLAPASFRASHGTANNTMSMFRTAACWVVPNLSIQHVNVVQIAKAGSVKPTKTNRTMTSPTPKSLSFLFLHPHPPHPPLPPSPRRLPHPLVPPRGRKPPKP